MLKAVLLDVDGTLLDSNDAHARAWREALLAHGRDVPYDTIRPLIGKGGDKLLREVAGIDDQSAEGQAISDERRALFAGRFLPELKPTPGARDLLVRLQSEGFLLVVATSAGGEELGPLLKQAGVEDLLTIVASSSDATASKPEPDIVHAALEKGRIRPDEAIMLGDTPYDIDSARAAGVRSIVVRCGGWWSDSALAGAAAIYDDPAHLLLKMAESPLHREPG